MLQSATCYLLLFCRRGGLSVSVCVCCSPLHAVSFSAVTGLAGVVTLAVGVNSLSALLALSNLLTYCAVYTPMKRLSTANTSLGAVVGAIPPMIGWAAATSTLDIGLCCSYHQLLCMTILCCRPAGRLLSVKIS